MASTDDDFYNSLAQKYQRNATLRWLLTVVNGTVFCGWVIGASGLSIAWLVLLIAVVAMIWSSNLIQVIEFAKSEEVMKVRRQKALSKDETAEWLNILFNRWWVFSSRSIFQLLRERFEPLLNDAKPSFVENVELRQFTFGEQTPCVKSVKTFDVVDGKRIPYSRQTPSTSSAIHTQYQVAVEVDLYLNSEEFRLLLRTRLFGKGMGVDLDISMEKLNVCGKLELLLTIDMDSPFPHVTDITLMFTEKPKVWFSIRMLKAVQMMEVPVLKTWIHSVFMDALETALVDPGNIHINLLGNQITPGINKGVSSAQGVLTVVLSISQLSSTNGDSKWIVLTMGDQYFKSSAVTRNWNESPSFLVESLKTDKLVIKLKSKRLISTVTLAQYEMVLTDYNLENSHTVETLLQKKSTKGSNIPNITVRLEYTPLPDISLDQPQLRFLDSSVVSGVVTVCIHSAHGLVFSDSVNCNSYCILFSNRRKVLTTHCVYNSTSPQWQSRCQILVNDYTQTSLSFVVCSSWNPKKMSNDEMLGVAVFNFAEGETWVQNRQLPLSGSAYCMPTLTVSVTFQPIGVMNDTGTLPPSSPGSDIDSKSDTSNGKSKKPYSSLMQHAKHLLGKGDQELQSGLSISQILSNGLGLMEISILQARDLIPMDKNGLSDPYCELRVNGDCKYKTSVKKKTLHPVWEENTIMGLPRPDETFEVLVWDRDIFGKNDFLGNVVFNLDEIRRMSALDSAMWYPLQGVRSGAIELKIRIISEDTTVDKNTTRRSFRKNSNEASPVVRRQSMERSHIRLGVNVPPPTPPRTVSIPQQRKVTQALTEVTKDVYQKPYPCLPYYALPFCRSGISRSQKATLAKQQSAKLKLTQEILGDTNPRDDSKKGRKLTINHPTTKPNLNFSKVSSSSTPPYSSLQGECSSRQLNNHRLTSVNRDLNNGGPAFLGENSDLSAYSSTQSLCNSSVPLVTVTESPLLTRTSSRASSQATTDISICEPSPPEFPPKRQTDSEISAFRSMREKVSRSLRLRRFKSEVNVRQQSKSASKAKDRNEVDFLQRDILSHAISQPNIRNGKSPAVRPTELNVCPVARPDKYSGVEGKVLQAQGLHVAHVAQLYCRIKLIGAQTNEKNYKCGQNTNGKTLAKSHLLPAVPNPQFDLSFQISSPESVPRQAILLFEIRSSGKEVVAVRRVTLQDLLSAEGKETHTWLALSNGATLEVTVAHGKELKKQSKKLFRSWSVHRIGKI